MGLALRGMSGSEKRGAILGSLERLRANLGITGTLRSRGMTRSDVSGLAAQALGDACLVTNPRRPNRRDLEVIYEEAL
jgi:alcohol dehydrogenase class IV